MKQFYIYILASKKNGTLYIGVTGDLVKRIYAHKHGMIEGFTKQYHTKQLVYFEATDDIQNALHREKRLKKWNRKWKVDLIEKNNPTWNDLYFDLSG